MAWATHYIASLKANETVSFRPRGHSMKGKIESGQLCTVEPIRDPASLQVGDVVLCKVNGHQYLHLIKAIQGKRPPYGVLSPSVSQRSWQRLERFQIGNNVGGINGWVTANQIYGRLIKVEA